MKTLSNEERWSAIHAHGRRLSSEYGSMIEIYTDGLQFGDEEDCEEGVRCCWCDVQAEIVHKQANGIEETVGVISSSATDLYYADDSDDRERSRLATAEEAMAGLDFALARKKVELMRLCGLDS